MKTYPTLLDHRARLVAAGEPALKVRGLAGCEDERLPDVFFLGGGWLLRSCGKQAPALSFVKSIVLFVGENFNEFAQFCYLQKLVMRDRPKTNASYPRQ